MTTPRDDIAGLIDGWSCNERNRSADSCRNPCGCHCREITALQARVKELEGNAPKFERDSVDYLICEGHHHVDESCEFERFVPEVRALRVEQELDELQLRFDKLTSLVGGIVIELGCAADSEAVFEAIARLRQERDEAYARAATIAENPPKLEGRGHACIATGRSIAATIRRLAGPEKEGK